jgi:hypothetical protein
MASPLRMYTLLSGSMGVAPAAVLHKRGRCIDRRSAFSGVGLTVQVPVESIVFFECGG